MAAEISTPDLNRSSTNDNEVLVKVEGVGKRFCKDLKRSLFYGVQDVFNDLRGKGLDASELRKREFWANDGISFELRRGECLGLIGRNGAGKTTLLKMLNGLIKPDKGRIEIKGRVGALIALGAGFNPILTGRENVYVSASVYGLTKKEIDEKYDEIVEFAELEDFMESPVQNYSSGMKVRLGFAVATVFEPDLLLLDEVLAVGDSNFRAKCLVRVSDLLTRTAVIFVSHQESQVNRICDSVLWLVKGQNKALGPTKTILPDYAAEVVDLDTPSLKTHSLGGRLELKSIEIAENVVQGTDVLLKVEMAASEKTKISGYIIDFKDKNKDLVAQARREIDQGICFKDGEQLAFGFRIKNLHLNTGRYFLNLNLTGPNGKIIYFRAEDACYFDVVEGTSGVGAYQPDSEFFVGKSG